MIVNNSIDKSNLKKMYLAALNVEGYEDMLKEYIKNN